MSAVARWVADLWPAWSEARSLVVLFVLFGFATGVLAAAFVLGGFWALRGRASLQVPACRRCRSALRGAGREPPATCPECGADLAPRGRVQWLRFRRQPLTVLITAPIVLIGGTALAAVCAAEFFQPLKERLAQIDEQRARRFEFAARQGFVGPPVEAAGLNIVDPGTLLADLRSADPDTARAAAETIAELRAYPLLGSLSTQDAAALVTTLLRDLRAGGLPGIARDSRTGIALTTALLEVASQSSAIDDQEFLDLVNGADRAPRLALSSRVRPGAPVGVSVWDAQGPPVPVIEAIRVNGQPVTDQIASPAGRAWSSVALFDAPETPGTARVEVDWRAQWARRPAITGTSIGELVVADEAEVLPVLRGEAAATAAAGVSITLVVARMGDAERQLLDCSVISYRAPMLDGRIGVEVGDEVLWLGEVSGGAFGAVTLLLPPETRIDADTIVLRYEPRPALGLVLVLRPAPSPADRPATGATGPRFLESVAMQRLVSGVLGEPVSWRLTRRLRASPLQSRYRSIGEAQLVTPSAPATDPAVPGSTR